MKAILPRYLYRSIRRHKNLAALILFGWLIVGCGPSAPSVLDPIKAARHRHYAELYAPVVYQDTDPVCLKCDFLTKFNYDGNYVAVDNWQNLARYDTVPAYVYYAFSETDTHIFLSYFFFHPRDWGVERGPINVPLSEHENDLEGILVVIEKGLLDGSNEIIGVETQAHNQQYQFSACPDSNADGILEPFIQNGSHGEDVDGCILLYQSESGEACNAPGDSCLEANRRTLILPDNGAGIHPMVASQANGHGVTACLIAGEKSPLGLDCVTPQTGEGVLYYFGGKAEEPADLLRAYQRQVSYQLIGMDDGTKPPGDTSEDQGLWYLRDLIGDNSVYASWGIFRGDDDNGPDMDCGGGLARCFQNSARAPWAWDDPDDNQVFMGDIFCDPAFAFDSHVDGVFEKNYSLAYQDHIYFTHQFSMPQVRINQGNCDRAGANDCDLFFTAAANGSPGQEIFIGEGTWKKNNAEAGVWLPWFLGGGNAAGPNIYGQNSSTRYICRSGGQRTRFTIQAWDADPTQNDPLGNAFHPKVPSGQLLREQNLGDVSIQYQVTVQEEARRSWIWPKILVQLMNWLRGLLVK